MPLSLNLPYSACYPLTLLARKLRPQSHPRDHDQATYFDYQYRDTAIRHATQMGGLDLKGKAVLDVGSGLGGRALGWLDLGAAKVINIDINRQELQAGQSILEKQYRGRMGPIQYHHPAEISGEVGDVAILFDCFEHLTEPASVLEQIHQWLRPGGLVWIGSIGWYNHTASHLTGGHIPIPWCQCIFSERAIIKTMRKLLRSPSYVPNVWERIEGLDRWDKVSTLRDFPGEPLNMLSLRKVRRVLKASAFEIRQFHVHGFGGTRNKAARLAAPLAKMPVLQELFHAYYTAVLEKPKNAVSAACPQAGQPRQEVLAS